MCQEARPQMFTSETNDIQMHRLNFCHWWCVRELKAFYVLYLLQSVAGLLCCLQLGRSASALCLGLLQGGVPGLHSRTLRSTHMLQACMPAAGLSKASVRMLAIGYVAAWLGLRQLPTGAHAQCSLQKASRCLHYAPEMLSAWRRMQQLTAGHTKGPRGCRHHLYAARTGRHLHDGMLGLQLCLQLSHATAQLPGSRLQGPQPVQRHLAIQLAVQASLGHLVLSPALPAGPPFLPSLALQ